MRGFWKLTWLETTIFLREPLGAIGTFVFPILLFVMLGRIGGGRLSSPTPRVPSFIGVDLPIFISIMIAIGAVMSLATIVANSVCEQFEISEAEAMHDAEEFVSQLSTHGILLVSDQPIDMRSAQ